MTCSNNGKEGTTRYAKLKPPLGNFAQASNLSTVMHRPTHTCKRKTSATRFNNDEHCGEQHNVHASTVRPWIHICHSQTGGTHKRRAKRHTWNIERCKLRVLMLIVGLACKSRSAASPHNGRMGHASISIGRSDSLQ